MGKILVNGNTVTVECRTELVSDGYHSFKELYDQRLILSTVAFKYAQLRGHKVWRALRHHGENGPCFGGGWFHVGVTTPDGDYSYHYKLDDYSLFDFAEDVINSPEWDRHTANDIGRLLSL